MINIINIFSIIFIGLFGTRLLVKILKKLSLKVDGECYLTCVTIIRGITGAACTFGAIYIMCVLGSKIPWVGIVAIICTPLYIGVGMLGAYIIDYFLSIAHPLGRLLNAYDSSIIDYEKATIPSDRILLEVAKEYVEERSMKKREVINLEDKLNEYKTIVKNNFSNSFFPSGYKIVTNIESHIKIVYTNVGWMARSTFDMINRVKWSRRCEWDFSSGNYDNT